MVLSMFHMPPCIMEPADETTLLHVSPKTLDTGCKAIHQYCYHSKKFPDLYYSIRDMSGYEERTDHGWTPLMIASSVGAFRVVQHLLNRNVFVNDCTPDNATALFVASQNGHADVVELLLNKGASVNKSIYNYVSPLYAAVRKGHLETVKFLLNNNADPNLYNAQHGKSPLHKACLLNCVDIAVLLLEHGARINEDMHNDSVVNLFLLKLRRGISYRAPDEESYINLLYRESKFGQSNEIGEDIDERTSLLPRV